MVEIITGGERSSREKLFIDRICAAASSGGRVLVIVPDQYSFEYDKTLYEHLGAKRFNSIETTGFNRLAEDIVNNYGSKAKDIANDNAQMILMYRAVKKFSKEGAVRYYKNSLSKAAFIGELTGLLPQLRQSGVTPEMLQLAGERLEGSVSLKLLDLSQIFKNYMAELEAADMNDSLSVMEEAVQLTSGNKVFEGKEVFVSAFTDFSYDERKILDICIRQSSSLTVSLLLDDAFAARCRTHPFDVTVKTRQQLADMARAHSREVRFTRAEDIESDSLELMQLSERLFDYSRMRFTAHSDSVQVLAADDMYEEADYICAEICRLVREKGYSYNDIAVTVRGLESFGSVIESAMEKYDIPFFLDKRDSVDASAIVHYINTIFKTVLTREFRTDNIMKLIKSPLFGLLNYEICDLEDYCIRWGVDRDMWLEDFTAKPENGMSLERINYLRSQVITPLAKFKAACRDASAEEISRAFYELLGELHLSEKTYSLVKRISTSDNDTEIEMSRGLKQLWSMSLSAVKSIYEILGSDKISLRSYYELYSLMLSRMKVSVPPQKLDCVRVIDAAHSRIGSVKAVFAAEVNDGIFPAAVKSRGLMTEHEKELLRVKEDINIDANAINDLMHERLAAYSALCAPSERLYVIYSRADLLGNEKRPSVLVKEVCEVLGIKAKNINTLPVDFFCTSYKTAYIKYIEHSRDNSVSVSSIRDSLIASPYYYEKLSALRQANSDAPYKLSKKSAEETFFAGDRAEVSPTKLDNYFKCPFMYFCNYGLHLSRSQKMDMDGMNKGLIIHSVLEKAIDTASGDPKENRRRFLEMNDEQINELIENCFDEYYNDVFCGDFGKSKTFRYRFEQMKHQAFNIVRYVQKELAHGEFSPVVTEYKLTGDGEEKHLDLTLDDGRHIVLIGTIDRADIYEDENGRQYVRIVDYKFRKHANFDLARLYCGLDLQMLIYLSILLETGAAVGEDIQLQQAGVFYLKLIGDGNSLSADSELSEEKLYSAACESAINSFSRKGRISDISEVNTKLDSEIGKTALTNMTMSDPMFTAMRIFAERKVIEYGNRLSEGDIDADPLEDICGYCQYAGICGRAFPEEPKKGSKEQMKEVLEEIMKESEEGAE
ncbi:PD-(D/E)XK nuclease family protein [Ruminococcus sp.]|uniref:PD-(D/E)XK nuclease family protein n=1 Tax=Ruminococcus sp. TaxID=41978 RepID=UPI0025DD9EBB|nr:PD-(D/E)XK nuclease family protein [Ruminococcus sp.]MBQ8967640.1 PD-(D/E)XK nuclease family protein [Ruminococcus sp.]